MSDPQPQSLQDSRGRNWRPWALRELTPASPRQLQPKAGPVAEPAVDMRRRELENARERGQREGYQAGYEEGFSAAREKGYEAGYAEALAAARQEAEAELARQVEAAVRPLQPLAEAFRGEAAAICDAIGDDVVELAMTVGEQLARDTLKTRPTTVLKLVKEVLEAEFGNGSRPVLHLHSQDLAIVSRHLGSELEALGWTLHADDRLTRGGCTVTTASGSLDATWESRLTAVNSRRRRRSTREGRPAAGDKA